jgi:hypothetical protein
MPGRVSNDSRRHASQHIGMAGGDKIGDTFAVCGLAIEAAAKLVGVDLDFTLRGQFFQNF